MWDELILKVKLTADDRRAIAFRCDVQAPATDDLCKIVLKDWLARDLRMLHELYEKSTQENTNAKSKN